jgi:hypothetical protein
MVDLMKQDRALVQTKWLASKYRRAFEKAKRGIFVHRAEALCACLLFMFAANLLATIARKSITNDEIFHIPAGYYHLVNGNFRPNNEHPPLVKMWAALPLLIIQPEAPPPPPSYEERGNFSEPTNYHQSFWSKNKGRFEIICFWTRATMIPVAVGLGLIIFAYARSLFGARAGVLAVALYTLEPTVLAHGRIVHTDVPAALAFLLFFFVLRRYLIARTLRRAMLLALVSGMALVVKFSMIVVLLVLVCLALIGLVFAPRLKESRKRLAMHVVMAACVIIFVVNAAYYFRSPPLESADVHLVQRESASAFDDWMTFFRAGSRVVPTYYLFGQYNVLVHNRDGHPTSLLGNYSQRGWWYYFPVAFAIKTSLPFLILSFVALVWSAFQSSDRRFIWLLAPFVLYAALSMSSRINIGVRHFLPAYPFLFIAGGALLDRLLRVQYARQVAVAFVALLFGWMGVEVVRAYPNYVPYMNQIASGHPRWWYLSDSNVEWGDDARDLAEYLHARGETEVSGALAGGWGTLPLYGITYHRILPRAGVNIPETRYVAIGASSLNGSVNAALADEHGNPLTESQRINYFAGYRGLTPEAVIGNSIYLYRVK